MPILEVFDDIIDKPLQEKIKSDILNPYTGDFYWRFIEDITSSSFLNVHTQKRPGLNHMFYEDSLMVCNYSWMTQDIVLQVIDKLKLKMTQIIKSKTFLQVPLNLKDYTVDNAHVDMMKPHLVILYYVMDSDGDTIIYNSQWEKGEDRKSVV